MPHVTIHYPEAGTTRGQATRRVRVPDAARSVVVMAVANGLPFVVTATSDVDHAVQRFQHVRAGGFQAAAWSVRHDADGWTVGRLDKDGPLTRWTDGGALLPELPHNFAADDPTWCHSHGDYCGPAVVR